MERISYLGSVMGTGGSFLRRWRPADALQRTPPTLKIPNTKQKLLVLIDMQQQHSEPAVIQLPLSTLDNMKMEIAWRTADIQEKIWEVIDGIEQIKEEFGMNKEPLTPLHFDPLQTIGKR
jgi:hypothetical protein